MKDMPVSYQRLLLRLERQEARLLRGGRDAPAGGSSELEKKIPPAVREALESAFFQAFRTLFRPESTRLIEKTVPTERLHMAWKSWQGELQPREERELLRQMERDRRRSRTGETLAAGAEGTMLGLLGIGLPDIPVLLALLLRSLYQSALRCGFSYESPEERVYLLLLLQGALSQGEERRALSGRADRLGRALDHGWPVSVDLENETGAAAALLARKVVRLKFVRGCRLVGAVGGAGNLSLAGRVSRWGALKYKKRFLEKKVRGL